MQLYGTYPVDLFSNRNICEERKQKIRYFWNVLRLFSRSLVYLHNPYATF